MPGIITGNQGGTAEFRPWNAIYLCSWDGIFVSITRVVKKFFVLFNRGMS